MTESTESSATWSRIAGTSQALVRSRIEIVRILHAIAADQAPLTAYFEADEQLFISRIRRVDSERMYIVMDYSRDKAANAAALTADAVVFSSSHDGVGIEFVGNSPSETTFDSTPALRFAMPEALLVHQRRAHRRMRSVPGVPLRCIADTHGIIPFEAEIMDISIGGMGAVVYDRDICLEPGTVLGGCKIVHPNGSMVELDIEVCYTVPFALADGSPVHRAGCRFIGNNEGLETLLKVFILDLEKSPDGDGESP